VIKSKGRIDFEELSRANQCSPELTIKLSVTCRIA
jgi:hypothetical protein